ncbi:MAG: YbhB/YbcL family Raf kinase inhibitor-like protein [Mycobacterium sp.]|nr:YbhB/YbcL family Raf kinase inhibitor-like protein [Mycobacterium sp.]
MPNPGSHRYDIERTRLRGEYDDHGVPDQHADRAANEQLQQDNPPRTLGDPDRAAGPSGNRGQSRGDPDIGNMPAPPAGQPQLRSAAFSDHTPIPDRYSRDGGNISPPLEWGAVPDGARELVLICEDPDAPAGTFIHWVLTGIDPGSTGVAENGVPQRAKPGRNGFGELGWGGPRPPVGDEPHRYFFRLYAADRPLGLGEGATADDVRAALQGHTLGCGTLVGLFGR